MIRNPKDTLQGIVECGVCKESYDLKEKLPLNLKCGHSFCLECINLMFRVNNTIKCPLCRKENNYIARTELNKNYGIINILE